MTASAVFDSFSNFVHDFTEKKDWQINIDFRLSDECGKCFYVIEKINIHRKMYTICSYHLYIRQHINI